MALRWCSMKSTSAKLSKLRTLMTTAVDLSDIADCFMDLAETTQLLQQSILVNDPMLLEMVAKVCQCIPSHGSSGTEAMRSIGIDADPIGMGWQGQTHVVLYKFRDSQFYHGVAVDGLSPAAVCFFRNSAVGLVTRIKQDGSGCDMVRFRLSATPCAEAASGLN